MVRNRHVAEDRHRGVNQSDQPCAYQTSALSIAIKNFSPIWFLISMDTGIISIIMKLLPWRFNGLDILATIMFVFNLVLFSCFTLISLVRLFKYPRHAKHEAFHTVDEMSYMGAPAISYLTLVTQVSLTCSEAWGYGMSILAYVLWWIGLVWTVTLCSLSLIVLSKQQLTNDREISPAMFLPLISVMTQGTTGGVVVNYSVGLSSTLGVPVIIVSFLCVGYAISLAAIYYAIFVHRLIAVGPPKKAKLPSIIITVGPLGQFATAIQLLGRAAYTGHMFGNYNKGTFLTEDAASSISAVCVLIALMVVGFAFLWITVAWYLVIEALVQRKLPYGMSWWSMIFPTGVLTTALINLSYALDSPGFRGLSAALLLFMLLVYFVNWGFTIWRMYTGVAFQIPQERQEERRKRDEIECTVSHRTDGTAV